MRKLKHGILDPLCQKRTANINNMAMEIFQLSNHIFYSIMVISGIPKELNIMITLLVLMTKTN